MTPKEIKDLLQRDEEIMTALKRGLAHGDLMYDKPYDRALAIASKLREAGFAIVRKRGK